MRFQISILLTILTLTILFTGCPSGEQPNANPKSTNTNTNVPANNPTNSGVTTPTRTPDAPTANNAPTLTPVVRGYYDALKKKDDAGLRKVLSADFIKSLETDMKEEKKTNLAAFAAETDKVPATPVEV